MSPEYRWPHADLTASHEYLLPAVRRWIEPHHSAILDLGCGNGALTAALAASLSETPRSLLGIDSSESGIELGHHAHAGVAFRNHDLSDPLPNELRNSFDLVLAVEVIEHLFLPRTLFARAREALRPNGQLIITTPHHGYLKNLALAVSNRFDEHWNPLTDYGHIKFFSRRTLTAIAEEQGFCPVAWAAVGRVPALAKSLCVLLEACGASRNALEADARLPPIAMATTRCGCYSYPNAKLHGRNVDRSDIWIGRAGLWAELLHNDRS